MLMFHNMLNHASLARSNPFVGTSKYHSINLCIYLDLHTFHPVPPIPPGIWVASNPLLTSINALEDIWYPISWGNIFYHRTKFRSLELRFQYFPNVLVLYRAGSNKDFWLAFFGMGLNTFLPDQEYNIPCSDFLSSLNIIDCPLGSPGSGCLWDVEFFCIMIRRTWSLVAHFSWWASLHMTRSFRACCNNPCVPTSDAILTTTSRRGPPNIGLEAWCPSERILD